MRCILLLLALITVAAPLPAARTFANGLYINAGNPAILTGTSYTVSVWGRATTDNGSTITWRSTASNTPIKFQISTNSGNMDFAVRDDANHLVQSFRNGSYSLNTWTHFAGVRAGNTITAYVAGVAGTSASTTLGTITANQLLIGAYTNSGSPAFYWIGQLAEVALWETDLTAAEIASLSRGMSPLLIRPSALALYVPLWGSARDYRSALSLTDTGTTASNDHPRLYR